MKFVFGGGAALTGVLLAGSFLIFVPTSIAEPIQEQNLQKKSAPVIQPTTEENKSSLQTRDEPSTGATVTKVEAVTPPAPTESSTTSSSESTAAPTESFTATAYSLYGRTASGAHVKKGIIAADRKVLPIGTKVRLDAGSYSGEYEVCDTGGAVRGKKIDLWVPSTREAMRFGRRKVKLTVLSYPKKPLPRRKAAAKT